MKKHAFIMIRYSVLSENNTAWVIGRDNDFEEYKKELFSEERMGLHEQLFFNVTVPSLKVMSPEKTTILVFTSAELPKRNMDKLNKLTSEMANLKVIPLSSSGGVIGKMQNHLMSFIESLNQDLCYATIRLDDDDALADDFESEIYKYIDPLYEGHAVSFSNGYEGLYEGDGYSLFSKRKSPKVAMGLSFIQTYKKSSSVKNISVYGLGNHTKVDEKYPTVINPLKPMYIRTVHAESDIFSNKFSKRVSSYNDIETSDFEEVANRFTCLRNPNDKIVNLYTSLKVLSSEKFESACLTHHNTILCYSNSKEIFLHASHDSVDFDDIEPVYLDKKNNCLKTLSKNVFYCSKLNGLIASSVDSDFNDTVLKKRGRGFSIGTPMNESFISPERDGSIGIKKKCRQWEVFYCN